MDAPICQGALEFLEGSLASPVHFRKKLAPAARHALLRRYYGLDGRVVREVLRRPAVLQNRLQGEPNRSARADIERVALGSGERAPKVGRVLLNLQRACQWAERAAWQAQRSSLEDLAVGPGGVLVVPELEALGEPLCWRYRSLAFALLAKFDLCGRPSQSLASEDIEDVASVLLACGGVPEVPDARVRFVEVLCCHGEPAAAAAGGHALVHLAVAQALRAGGALDAAVRESLCQLEAKVLRPRLGDYRAALLQSDPVGARRSAPEERHLTLAARRR
ncbi:unnamed protein product [Prorocentrum cordatum]|uniref:Uncharacterized protein n=1 Tax=Prorocentrum cordatum TaxID=2364126 RepID=A0ABN9W0G5_9DINO|nr:unnamed protein product [Polarella glacialis]